LGVCERSLSRMLRKIRVMDSLVRGGDWILLFFVCSPFLPIPYFPIFPFPIPCSLFPKIKITC